MVMVNSSAGGGNDAVTVNLTPPGIPLPYGSHATRSVAIPNVPHILVAGGPIHNMATIIPFTTGDAPGSMGGVMSGTVGAMSRNTMGATTVLVQGMPTTRMTDPTLQNATNAVGTGTSPSQSHILNLAP